MALPSSGQLSLNQIHVEAGGTSGTSVTLNDSDVRGLITKGDGTQNKISEYYGASSTPAHTDDLTTTVGIPSGNTFYYLQQPSTYSPSGATATNLYHWSSSTVTMKFAFTASGNSTFGQSGSNGGAQNPASIADNSGHVHDNIAYCYDGGDGYAPGTSYFYWKAASGGRMLGNGTAGNWGGMEVYSPLTDFNTAPTTGAPNGSFGNNDGYLAISAESSGNNNLVTAGDDIPYGINSDISMIYAWAGSLGATIYFHADIT